MNLGIDFGTSYTKMAYWDNGQLIDLLENRRIPSIATYVPLMDKLFFGPKALQLADGENISALFFKLNLKRNPGFHLGPFSLDEMLFSFFTYLQNQYMAPAGIRPTTISLSVPNNFGLRARRTLINAAQNAFALSQITLVPEPLAALIGFNAAHNGTPVSGELLSIDVGGGTSDFSFLSFSHRLGQIVLESQFQVGQDALSGSEIDRMVLRQIMAPAFQLQHAKELPTQIVKENFCSAQDRFWFNHWIHLAEELKIAMSTREDMHFSFPYFYQDQSLSLHCTREKFGQGIKPVYDRLRRYWEEAVRPRAHSLGLLSGSKWNMDAVLLLGGASQTRGLEELVASLCPGVPVLQSSDPDFNVIRGLCCWSEIDLATGLKLKTVYPFRFYLEKRIGDQHSLEEIPFDTANLELDFGGHYEICSVPIESSFNLAEEEERFNIRAYELAEESGQADLNRFMDQDLVLELDVEKARLESSLTLYLNLKKSRLELDNNDLLSKDYAWEDNLINKIKQKQRSAYDLFSAYKFMDEGLLEDYYQHLDEPSQNGELISQDSSDTALFKILSIMQLYKDN